MIRIGGPGQSVLEVAGHDTEGGAGFAVGIDTIFVFAPELRRAIDYVEEEDEEESHNRHGDQKLKNGKALELFDRIYRINKIGSHGIGAMRAFGTFF